MVAQGYEGATPLARIEREDAESWILYDALQIGGGYAMPKNEWTNINIGV